MRPLWDLSGARAAPYTTQKLNLLTGGADKLFRGSVAGRCGRRYWAIKSWLPACYWARWHGDGRRFFLAPPSTVPRLVYRDFWLTVPLLFSYSFFFFFFSFFRNFFTEGVCLFLLIILRFCFAWRICVEWFNSKNLRRWNSYLIRIFWYSKNITMLKDISSGLSVIISSTWNRDFINCVLI